MPLKVVGVAGKILSIRVFLRFYYPGCDSPFGLLTQLHHTVELVHQVLAEDETDLPLHKLFSCQLFELLQFGWFGTFIPVIPCHYPYPIPINIVVDELRVRILHHFVFRIDYDGGYLLHQKLKQLYQVEILHLPASE